MDWPRLNYTPLAVRLVMLLGIMILPFVAYTFVRSYEIRSTLEAEVAHTNLEKATNIAHLLDQHVASTKDLVTAIAASEPARSGDTTALAAWFREMFGTFTTYSNIIYVDANGDILVAARWLASPRATNVADTVYFKRAMASNGPVIGDFMHGKLSGTPVVHVATPVYDRDGHKRGVVAAALDMTRIQRELLHFTDSTKTVIALVDSRGTLLARSAGDPRMIGTNVASTMPMFREMVRRESGTGKVLAPDGMVRVFAFAHSEAAPWYVRVGTDANVIAAQTAARQRDNVVIFVALALVAFAGWLWLGRDMERLHRETQRLALVDPLTGLWNFRKLDYDLESHLNRSRRYGQPLSCLMIDIDHFKDFNDEYGHIAGDRVLKCIASVISDAVRESDLVYRYGGEEFCVLMPDTDKEGARSVAERVRAAVESECFVLEDSGVECRLTVSIGIATFPEDALDVGELLKRSDFALYDAKRAGRNRVEVY